MGKNPNPARMNHTRTQVLPRTKQNPNLKVKNVQESKPNRTLPCKEPNRTRAQISCFLLGSFTEWNYSCIHTFHNKRGILFHL